MTPELTKEITINVHDTHPIQVASDLVAEILETNHNEAMQHLVSIAFDYLIENLDSEEQSLVNILFYDDTLESDEDKWMLKLFVLDQFYGLMPDVIGDIVLDLEIIYPGIDLAKLFMLRKKLGTYASELNDVVFDTIEAEM